MHLRKPRRVTLLVALLVTLLAVTSFSLALPTAAHAQQHKPKDPPKDKPEPVAKGPYEVLYDVRVVPSEKIAYVKVRLAKNARYVKSVTFITDPERHMDFDGDGEVTLGAKEVTWRPPDDDTAELRYSFRIDHLRDAQRYDARVTSTWALFRGDDLVPPARVVTVDNARASSRLRLRLPEGWKAVSPYPKASNGTLSVDNPERRFDRPTGWFLLGKLNISRTTVAGSKITVATPRKHGNRRQDLLAFLRFTLPDLKDLLGDLPERVTIVSAGDPMWRGGLSGPGSLYLHAERPLIDKDFTSPVLHEIVHTAMGARAGRDGDWIVEGLAELYSIEALYRSKGISKTRYKRAFEKAKDKGEAVKDLLVPHADAKVTARALTVLKELDDVMAERCQGRLADVVKRLMVAHGSVTTAGFRGIAEDVGQCDLAAFFEEHAPGSTDGGVPRSEPAPRPSAAAAVP